MIGFDVLVLEGASASAVGTTIDVVSAANRIVGKPTFDLRFVSPESRVTLRGGLVADAQPLARTRPRDVIVTPGLGAATAEEIADRLGAADIAVATDWLSRARRAHIAASCTAVFVLAAAGVLEGRRCVTTWWLGAELAEVAPAARVVIDEMVVRDGPIWTAGSAFAHIDLMLALLRYLGGAALADELANRLVADQRTSQAGFLIPSHLAARDETVAPSSLSSAPASATSIRSIRWPTGVASARGRLPGGPARLSVSARFSSCNGCASSARCICSEPPACLSRRLPPPWD
jgi:transcriptional regulator GlxA family with amidase domain